MPIPDTIVAAYIAAKAKVDPIIYSYTDQTPVPAGVPLNAVRAHAAAMRGLDQMLSSYVDD